MKSIAIVSIMHVIKWRGREKKKIDDIARVHMVANIQ